MTQQDQAPSNPLFEGFKPQPIEQPQSQTAPKPKRERKKREPKAAKAAPVAKPKKERKPRPAKLKPVEPPVQNNLQLVFAAVKELEDADYPLFEKLLAASPASRKRVFVAIAKVFP